MGVGGRVRRRTRNDKRREERRIRGTAESVQRYFLSCLKRKRLPPVEGSALRPQLRQR